MADFFGGVNNPGIDFRQLTSVEVELVEELAALNYQTGDILYYDGSQLQRLPIGSSTEVLTVIGGIPSWEPSSGAGFTLLSATGSVNSVNANFTFTEKPDYIVSDGVWYRENVGWTWSGLTATMVIPPNDDIWGFT